METTIDNAHKPIFFFSIFVVVVIAYHSRSRSRWFDFLRLIYCTNEFDIDFDTFNFLQLLRLFLFSYAKFQLAYASLHSTFPSHLRKVLPLTWFIRWADNRHKQQMSAENDVTKVTKYTIKQTAHQPNCFLFLWAQCILLVCQMKLNKYGCERESDSHTVEMALKWNGKLFWCALTHLHIREMNCVYKMENRNEYLCCDMFRTFYLPHRASSKCANSNAFYLCVSFHSYRQQS